MGPADSFGFPAPPSEYVDVLLGRLPAAGLPAAGEGLLAAASEGLFGAASGLLAGDSRGARALVEAISAAEASLDMLAAGTARLPRDAIGLGVGEGLGRA